MDGGTYILYRSHNKCVNGNRIDPYSPDEKDHNPHIKEWFDLSPQQRFLTYKKYWRDIEFTIENGEHYMTPTFGKNSVVTQVAPKGNVKSLSGAPQTICGAAPTLDTVTIYYPTHSVEIPKKDTRMYLDTDATNTDLSQKNFFLVALDGAFGDKDYALRGKYGLRDDDSPDTQGDAIERLLAGKFCLSEENRKRAFYGEFRGLRWRDPNVVEDRKGYEAARKLLEETRDTTANKIVAAADGASALAAFDAFKATVH